MKRKVLAILVVLIMVLALAVPAFAQGGVYMVDNADLLLPSEVSSIQARLDSIGEYYKTTLAIVTEELQPNLSDAELQDYADTYYEKNYGKGTDGVLLLVDMTNHFVYISTSGPNTEPKFTDTLVDNILDDLMYDLKSEDYEGAFNTFCDDIRTVMEYYTNPNPNPDPTPSPSPSPNPAPKEKNLSLRAIISLAVSFITALIVTGSMKGALKSIRQQRNANKYKVSGSLNLRVSSDDFMYMTKSSTPKPRDNSNNNSHINNSSFGGPTTTHMSSGGVSHGGGGRHF